ncbi:uncharacterized protein LOC119632628 [Glossina fuscipes]|uniref:Uncharacterized protein LOC119632628 n=1 Tax=Glossina fuscipes TaxID=7396 RepID=A0A8U0W8L4_9MUSC|nr:uncharacterized protein LOC119632628 [Glossina fuscipes]KAI9588035.1 hypothetical protein GQX74_003881 [Glossina fuscipes]
MSKKSAPALQADIQNDDDLEKFLDRSGLLILDIYTEWCGPCIGMVGTLRKLKLQYSDDLHFAIVKAEGVTAFHRFARKSEPTWLFVNEGKAVNILFGINVPALMQIVTHELTLLGNKRRPLYELHEFLPIEEKRKKVKEDLRAQAEAKEHGEEERKRLEYLTYVTDTIMDSLPDMGVTICGPQVNREAFKKMQTPADKLKIQCKDRTMASMTKEHFTKILSLFCTNIPTEDVIDQMIDKKLLMCFWKVPDEGNNIAVILTKFAHDLMLPHVVLNEETNEEEELPAILETTDYKVEVQLEDWEETLDEPEDDNFAKLKSLIALPSVTGDIEEEEAETEEDEMEATAAESTLDMPGLDLGLNLDLEENEEEEEEPEKVEVAPKKRTRKKIVRVNPIWVPNNHRTHAALIYLYFRSATISFLPPDPKPEPPHVIMAFDTYKKRDLIAHAERNKQDVPLYGFFTSDDPEDAKFIASSDAKYATLPHTPTDKLVFKVNKATSNTMLSLVTYGPSYISPNPIIGRDEAKKFFPEGYIPADLEQVEIPEEKTKPTKVKQQTKTKTKKEERKYSPSPAMQESDQAAGGIETGPTVQTSASSSNLGPQTSRLSPNVTKPPATAQSETDDAAAAG